MHSLIQYNKIRCGNRDSLSLFAEYCGDYKIRIHRQFYVNREYSNFMSNDVIDIIKLDFRDVTNDVEICEFFLLLKKLMMRMTKSKDDRGFANDLSNCLKQLNFYERTDNYEKLVDEELEKINEVFCKYRFSLEDNAFISDERVYSKLDELIKRVAYNREIHFEDYKNFCKPEIEPIINNNLYELRVFNVGQANCSALIKYTSDEKNDYKVIMVFDFGFQKRSGTNSKLDEMISKIDCETTILISHYDSDHINNISNHLYLTTFRWIFPNYDGRGKKALKTFQMLLKVATKKTGSGTIYNFPTPYRLSSNISIHQYSGSRIGDEYQSTIMNSKCLVCKISVGENDILIPADALYQEFGADLVLPNGKKYDHILVPHHGCKYAKKSLAPHTLKVWDFIDDHTVGYVMCGRNSYGHANENHLSWFKECRLFANTTVYNDREQEPYTVKCKKIDFFSIKF